MNTTMRDAVVNCRPTKMQANSAANSAPASRPPGSVPSRSNSAMPRQRAHSQTSSAPPSERSAACQSAGTSGSAALAATWFRPQRKQQPTSATTASASRWVLRSVIGAQRCEASRAASALGDAAHSAPATQPAGMRERRDGDVPAGRMAQRPRPTALRSAP